MFVDSHCHLDRITDDQNELNNIVKNAHQSRVEHMLCVAVSVREFEEMYARVKGFENVSVSCGVHPLHQEDACEKSVLKSFASKPQVVAVGETGLDYHYSAETKTVQLASFKDHIEVANELNKPLIIHTRNAQKDTLDLLQRHYDEETGAVLHCFTESTEMAMAAIEMGIYISISGIVTFKSAKALQDTVREIPLENLLIETDSPWLAPVPFRGKKNQPKYVEHVAEFIAQLKGVPVEELAKVTTQNFYDLFSGIKTKHPSTA